MLTPQRQPRACVAATVPYLQVVKLGGVDRPFFLARSRELVQADAKLEAVLARALGVAKQRLGGSVEVSGWCCVCVGAYRRDGADRELPCVRGGAGCSLLDWRLHRWHRHVEAAKQLQGVGGGGAMRGTCAVWRAWVPGFVDPETVGFVQATYGPCVSAKAGAAIISEFAFSLGSPDKQVRGVALRST